MTPPPAAAAAAAPAAPTRRSAPTRPRPVPGRPRRVSGPSRPAPARREPGARSQRSQEGLAPALAQALHALAHNRVLDRLIRGRLSIGIVAFALIGIVTLQLGLLRLNTSIGRTLERESVLQRENAALSIENSEMAAGDRVEARAAQVGMALAPIGALRFLTAGGGDAQRRATKALRTPLASESTGSAQAAGSASESSAGSSSSSTEGSASASSAEHSASAASSAEGSASTTSSSSTTQTPEASREGASSGSPSAQSRAEAPSSSQPTRSEGSAAESASGGAASASPAGGTQERPAG
jgi:hypothetical protein